MHVHLIFKIFIKKMFKTPYNFLLTKPEACFFLWSASADQSCVHLRHPVNFTFCARNVPCTYFIYCAMTTSLESLITRKYLNVTLIRLQILGNKIFIQLHIYWLKSRFSSHLRWNIYREYNSLSKSKAYSSLAISEINKTVLYIVFACSIMLSYYIKRSDQ